MKKLFCAVTAIIMIFSVCCTPVLATNINDVNVNDWTGFKDEWANYQYSSDSNTDRFLVYDEFWFRDRRLTYYNYESHYTTNLQLEGSSMGYIINQTTCPNFLIGNRQMANVGCEIAATYNALKMRGRRIPCASIIRHFEKNGYLMGVLDAGGLGSDPYAIGEYFADNYINYTRYTDYSTMQTAVNNSRGSQNVYIVSFWNTDQITGGLHTVALYTTTSDSKIHVYNLTPSSTSVAIKDNFSSFVASSRFIVGYNIPRLRTQMV